MSSYRKGRRVDIISLYCFNYTAFSLGFNSVYKVILQILPAGLPG